MMKIIIVDDEKIIRDGAENAIRKCVPDANVTLCESGQQALKEFNSSHFDVAFLDIEMPKMSGIELAKKIKKLSPETNIIFCTAHQQYTGEAMTMHASGYITKPLTVQAVKVELENLRHPVKVKKRGITVRAFGNFEVFSNEEPLRFKYNKTKELFAYLIDRNGAVVDIAEMRAALWEDDEDRTSYMKQLRKDLLDTMQAEGFEDVIVAARGGLGIVPSKIKCDFFDYMAGDPAGINAYHGEYMQQYSWAEVTHANLEMREI